MAVGFVALVNKAHDLLSTSQSDEQSAAGFAACRRTVR